jgi:hypothetical protein
MVFIKVLRLSQEQPAVVSRLAASDSALTETAREEGCRTGRMSIMYVVKGRFGIRSGGRAASDYICFNADSAVL